MFPESGCSERPEDDRGEFPTVRWKRETATFVVSNEPPDPSVAAPAALVFPFYGDRIVLADIVTRGWCIPSGHLEAGETDVDAVRRESMEEAGATLGKIVRLGYFVLTDPDSGVVRFAPTFVADVVGLGDLPDQSESRGRQLVAPEDIADSYFAWDDLLAAVFERAWELRAGELRAGVSISSLRAPGEELL